MKTSNDQFFKIILPVMSGFFIMGFVDLVGITTNYIKTDFGMSDSLLGLISVSCFIWFLLLSIPTGALMNRFGRKRVVLASLLMSFASMLTLAFAGNSFACYLIAFALLGMGNTLLQVGLNPLLSEVVAPENLTGSITLGQFVKAVCSFVAPIIAAACAGTVFGWKLIFPIYALVSFIAAVWLWLSPVRNTSSSGSGTAVSFRRTFALLRDKVILLFFIAILVLVGVDVGMNVTFPRFLAEHFSFNAANAGMGNSVYFLARTVGAFCGGLILLRINEKRFYLISISLAALALAGLILSGSPIAAMVSVAAFGLGYSNLFSIVFSLALKHLPQNSNEVSALLVTGIAGGALVTPVLGIVTDAAGNQTAALIALSVIWIYMFAIIGTVSRTSTQTR